MLHLCDFHLVMSRCHQHCQEFMDPDTRYLQSVCDVPEHVSKSFHQPQNCRVLPCTFGPANAMAWNSDTGNLGWEAFPAAAIVGCLTN